MITTPLPTEFSELLRLFNEQRVDYLLVGGYAVAYHGYPRTTGDLDIWIDRSAETARGVVQALRTFGFDAPVLQPGLFLQPDQVIRMGHPPLRIEILTSISGVVFADCDRNRVDALWQRVPVRIIGLDCLKANKRASGRYKDLSDLDHLP